MAINDLIVTELQAHHMLSLDNKLGEEDGIISTTPTEIKDGVYSFVTEPCCEGYTHCVQTSDSTSYTYREEGAILSNKSDINSSDSSYKDSSKTLMLWCRFKGVDTPSCIYEQGGGTNNMAFLVGLAKAITFQCADAGQPFLIAQTKSLAMVDRNYHLVGRWEYHGSANDTNQVIFYVNGVLQEIVSLTGTDVFPSHTGDIVIGNTEDSLKIYNESTLPLVARQKWVNMLGMYNGVSFTEENAREVFERTVLPEVTIEADTVVNQQSALDLLSGTSFSNKNCAIRILQATDESEYTLVLDNITFLRDDNYRDIHVQFVGTGKLSIVNANGSNAYELSTVSEVETTAGVIHGGGSLTLNPLMAKRVSAYGELRDETIEGDLYVDIDSNISIVCTNVRVGGYIINMQKNYTLDILPIDSDGLIALNQGTGAGQVNVHPQSRTFTITGVLNNSRVVIYDNEILDYANNNTILTQHVVSNYENVIYYHSGSNDVRKQVIKEGYIELLFDFKIEDSNQNLHIIQEIDSNG